MSDLYLPLVATPVSVWPLPLSGLRRSPTPAGIIQLRLSSSPALALLMHQEIDESLLNLYIALPSFPCVSICIILIYT